MQSRQRHWRRAWRVGDGWVTVTWQGVVPGVEKQRQAEAWAHSRLLLSLERERERERLICLSTDWDHEFQSCWVFFGGRGLLLAQQFELEMKLNRHLKVVFAFWDNILVCNWGWLSPTFLSTGIVGLRHRACQPFPLIRWLPQAPHCSSGKQFSCSHTNTTQPTFPTSVWDITCQVLILLGVV